MTKEWFVWVSGNLFPYVLFGEMVEERN